MGTRQRVESPHQNPIRFHPLFKLYFFADTNLYIQDETLLYGVEVKFYSNKVVVNKDFETSVKGLRAIGDGASVTRGLQQASANGISVARSILKAMEA
jgi:uncharacterized FAD-dependent dehydrogenase